MSAQGNRRLLRKQVRWRRPKRRGGALGGRRRRIRSPRCCCRGISCERRAGRPQRHVPVGAPHPLGDIVPDVVSFRAGAGLGSSTLIRDSSTAESVVITASTAKRTKTPSIRMIIANDQKLSAPQSNRTMTEARATAFPILVITRVRCRLQRSMNAPTISPRNTQGATLSALKMLISAGVACRSRNDENLNSDAG